MNRLFFAFLFLNVVTFCTSVGDSPENEAAMDTGSKGYLSPRSYEGYELVWEEAFEGNSLSNYWTHDLGNGCPYNCYWGNNELQHYRKSNTRVQNNLLTITADKSPNEDSFTSSRIKTQGKIAFTYGRMDIRAKLPKGKGIWPAIWMLGENITEVSWPNCGEIDIMEMIGGESNPGNSTIFGSLHWGGNRGQHRKSVNQTTLTEGIFNDQFHVFSIIWTPKEITWLLNDNAYKTIDITSPQMAAFHQPHFLLLNIAVGGDWPGPPKPSTTFPQEMKIDYIRVFQSL